MKDFVGIANEGTDVATRKAKVADFDRDSLVGMDDQQGLPPVGERLLMRMQRLLDLNLLREVIQSVVKPRRREPRHRASPNDFDPTLRREEGACKREPCSLPQRILCNIPSVGRKELELARTKWAASHKQGFDSDFDSSRLAG